VPIIWNGGGGTYPSDGDRRWRWIFTAASRGNWVVLFAISMISRVYQCFVVRKGFIAVLAQLFGLPVRSLFFNDSVLVASSVTLNLRVRVSPHLWAPVQERVAAIALAVRDPCALAWFFVAGQ